MAALNYRQNEQPVPAFSFYRPSYFWAGCSNGNPKNRKGGGSGRKKVYDRWLIDLESVESGCDRPDCIAPSIIIPNLFRCSRWILSDDDLVIGLRMEEVVRCYPHAILNWHEIVNDQIGENYVTINSMSPHRIRHGMEQKDQWKNFRLWMVSECYTTVISCLTTVLRSAWSQMKQLCVNGELADSTADDYQVIETTPGHWKTHYIPAVRYCLPRPNEPRLFKLSPITNTEPTMKLFWCEYERYTSTEERLFGVVQGNKAQCYRFNNFKGGVRILNDTAFEKNIIVVGSERDEFITAFENPQHKNICCR